MTRTIPVLLVLLVLVTGEAVQAQFNYSDNGNGTCAIIDYNGPGGAVALPTNINGLVVTIVGDTFFGQLEYLPAETSSKCSRQCRVRDILVDGCAL
jgi:hypothetical protein